MMKLEKFIRTRMVPARAMGGLFRAGGLLWRGTRAERGGRATNNCGEFKAAALAIRFAKQHGIKRLTVNTYSKFLTNSITKWLPG
ncbi:ribonuclease H1 [Culex quinquefasciatus]|uniref:Ribonuclease H1 n=1 Tax=Culex quinquefasciatus TaxID=7176 RepID=B0WWG1_CULQU|nr:ribonuclease H1 [Culex quinquefasciatus]|eukprot:XP_001861733.1 ribonuclease H1 [Culex quinquefasciatus]